MFACNFIICCPKIIFQFHKKESMLENAQLHPFSPVQSWFDWVWRSCFTSLPEHTEHSHNIWNQVSCVHAINSKCKICLPWILSSICVQFAIMTSVSAVTSFARFLGKGNTYGMLNKLLQNQPSTLMGAFISSYLSKYSSHGSENHYLEVALLPHLEELRIHWSLNSI